MIRQAALYLVRNIALYYLRKVELFLDPCQAQKQADYDQRKKEVETKERETLQEIEEIEGRLSEAAAQRAQLQSQLAVERAAIETLNADLRNIQDEKSEKLHDIDGLSDRDALRRDDL